jgi:hypothetical protein
LSQESQTWSDLTATSEQVINRLNYSLKIINSNTIKIITKKLEYHKMITDILKEKKVEFHTYHTSAATCVQSGNQRSTPLDVAGGH